MPRGLQVYRIAISKMVANNKSFFNGAKNLLLLQHFWSQKTLPACMSNWVSTLLVVWQKSYSIECFVQKLIYSWTCSDKLHINIFSIWSFSVIQIKRAACARKSNVRCFRHSQHRAKIWNAQKTFLYRTNMLSQICWYALFFPFQKGSAIKDMIALTGYIWKTMR